MGEILTAKEFKEEVIKNITNSNYISIRVLVLNFYGFFLENTVTSIDINKDDKTITLSNYQYYAEEDNINGNVDELLEELSDEYDDYTMSVKFVTATFNGYEAKTIVSTPLYPGLSCVYSDHAGIVIGTLLVN